MKQLTAADTHISQLQGTENSTDLGKQPMAIKKSGIENAGGNDLSAVRNAAVQRVDDILSGVDAAAKNTSSDYYFYGTISLPVLQNYLDRALLMSKMSNWRVAYGSTYTSYHAEDIAMVKDIKPKFIADIASLWGFWWGWRALLDELKKDIEYIHNEIDDEIICQASMFEEVDDGIDQIEIPSWVFDAFGLSGKIRNFRYKDMLYTDVAALKKLNPGQQNSVPDITKLEAQLWFYFLAVNYIDAGCEALHCGDVFLMDLRDRHNGHAEYWKLLQKIRHYASLHARRGLVLLDAHIYAPEEGNAYYYDPNPSHPAPDWCRQLLFDFHGTASPFWQNASARNPCSDTARNYPQILINNRGAFAGGDGGLNPQGWYCVHNPMLLDWDNRGIDSNYGCAHTANEENGNYGFDNITWLAIQPRAVRDQILKYIYYQVRCFGSHIHMRMPGRKNLSFPEGYEPHNDGWYRAETGSGPDYFNQQVTIKNIWANLYAGGYNWIKHEFIKEFTSNGSNNVAGSLVCSGPDKMFYIGTDGYIHGFVYVNYTWLSVSPSYAAELMHGQKVSNQVKAKSDLVASPDGRRLLYIGVNNYIMAIDIWSLWDYSFVGGFMENEMRAQNITALGSLIYPENDRIYYIATQNWYMGQYHGNIHGFQKASGVWKTVSPTYSAEGKYGQKAINQQKATYGLTYDKSASHIRLYYVGYNGHLYYFEVRDIISYYYVLCSANNSVLVPQQLRIQGKLAIYKNRIYYVGRYIPDGGLRIHCLIDNGSSWTSVSPSYSADYYNGQPVSAQLQSTSRGEICVSSDGGTIAYIGSGNELCIFYNQDDVKYSYLRTSIGHIFKYLQCESNGIFGISDSASILFCQFQEDYCSNPSINDYLKLA
ncbi:MAG: hypothetical protein H7257_14345 [Taibaiella sp.]|nr:hypothetical protein [Taibaiella sp.]